MAFYTALAATNTAGIHVFDAAALRTLVGYTWEPDRTHVDGDVIRLKNASEVVIASEIVLHRNGRTGSRDLDHDRIVLRISTLAALPDDLQVQLYLAERTPTGRRPVQPETR